LLERGPDDADRGIGVEREGCLVYVTVLMAQLPPNLGVQIMCVWDYEYIQGQERPNHRSRL
jgi:hypothetical protein